MKCTFILEYLVSTGSNEIPQYYTFSNDLPQTALLDISRYVSQIDGIWYWKCNMCTSDRRLSKLTDCIILLRGMMLDHAGEFILQNAARFGTIRLMSGCVYWTVQEKTYKCQAINNCHAIEDETHTYVKRLKLPDDYGIICLE